MIVDSYTVLKQIAQSVGTSAAPLDDCPQEDGMQMPDRVVLQALTSNSKSIFCKNANDVVIDGSTGGYELPPGGNIILPISVYKDFYVIAATAGQKLQLHFVGGMK